MDNKIKKDILVILNWLIGFQWPVDKDDFESLQKQANKLKKEIENET